MWSISGVDWTARNPDAAAMARCGSKSGSVVDVGDHDLGVCAGGACAGGALVVDGVEVGEEPGREAALGDDSQRVGLWVGELDVAAVGGEERDRAIERVFDELLAG